MGADRDPSRRTAGWTTPTLVIHGARADHGGPGGVAGGVGFEVSEGWVGRVVGGGMGRCWVGVISTAVWKEGGAAEGCGVGESFCEWIDT